MRFPLIALFISQFNNPIILILLFAAGLSFYFGDPVDTAIILIIVFISGALGFWQERKASQAVERLLAMVQVKADVLRDEIRMAVPLQEIVPGDVVTLHAGDTVPGDSLVLESKELFLNEAMLTGESFPVEKRPGIMPVAMPLARRSNSLFLGTHIVSGTGVAVVVRTGAETEFGRISTRLKLRPPKTEFERGIQRFGYLLLELTLGLVMGIFIINVFLARPVLESFLFSLALAVGLTPQLLPAIISINLAHGARRMAQHKVIVKHLSSIENFGSMTVFCADKTGTLTEGRVSLKEAIGVDGQPSERTHLYAFLNAVFESGFSSPLDEALRTSRSFDYSAYRKLDEEPYDFVRKRLSVLIATPTGNVMVTKGALRNVLDICRTAETSEGHQVDIAAVREMISHQMHIGSQQGCRTLGVAYRNLGTQGHITRTDETGMTYVGLLRFVDPPKSDVRNSIDQLRALGIRLKILTGDNPLVAGYVAQHIGLGQEKIVTGEHLRQMSDDALVSTVNEVDLFAEVEPNQKERIILALKKAGHVVGFGGDGINDASALHAADVGISVESAVDVAKEAADIILLEKNLTVLADGVREGRMTFANTLKYVFMATSANFGNMFSMAGASLFLPFLPLLPKQILLTNILTDIPEMTIATDHVDAELVQQPRRWDIPFIRRFMTTFGLVSSFFDFLTFGVLLFFMKAGTLEFRTGWFLESVVSASAIVLVIRTRRPFYKSQPGIQLLMATIVIIALTLAIPFTKLGTIFGFVPLSFSFFLAIALILGMYILAAEWTKHKFYERMTRLSRDMSAQRVR